MLSRKFIMSLGAALAAGKAAQLVSSVHLDDLLEPVGLARRRSHALENLLFLGAGAAIGAGAALLFAPASGQKTRQKLSREFSKLSEAAGDAIRETAESARALVAEEAQAAAGHSQSH